MIVRWRLPRVDRSDVAFGALVVGISIVAGKYAGSPTLARDVFAFAFVSLVVGFGLRAPRALLLGLPLWLVPLGMVRRLLTGISAAGPADPLLLIGPLAIVVLTFAAADRGAFRTRTTLSKLVLALSALIVLGAFNPNQSVTAGLAALIFFVPLLAFWIGRGLVDAALFRRVMLFAAAAAVPAAVYGLFQTFAGFPSWDTRWIVSQGYGALDVNGVTRPFASFSSSAEYATFLTVAMVVWLRLGPRRFLRPIGIAVVALVVVAAFYQSSRGTIVMILAGIVAMVFAQRRLPLWSAIAAGALFLFLAPAIVSHFAPKTYAAAGSGALVEHQLQGLANPFDPNASTAGAHLNLIRGGIQEAFRHPAGTGIAVVTLAGQKFGSQTVGTEADVSNAAVALGLPGLFLYVALFFVAYRRTYALARAGGTLPLLALGVITVTAMQWLNGGQYAVAFLPWLALGWVDAETERRGRAAAAAVEHVLPAAPRVRPRPRPAPPVEAPPPAAEPELPRAAGELNLFALEKLPGLTDEQRFLLFYLRDYASPTGSLPPEFAELLRDIRGDTPS